MPIPLAQPNTKRVSPLFTFFLLSCTSLLTAQDKRSHTDFISDNPDTSAPETYYWTGGKSSFFKGDHWNTKNDGTGHHLSTLEQAHPVNAHLIINSGNPGAGNVTSELELGSGSLLMNGGSLKFSHTNGITGGTVTVHNDSTHLIADHVHASNLTASGGAAITLSGVFINTPITNSGAQVTAAALLNDSNVNQSSGTLTLTSSSPFEKSTFNFTGASAGALVLSNLTPPAVASQWLDRILVDGSPAIATGSAQNVHLVTDGASGTLINVSQGFRDLDGDQMDDYWEEANFGDPSRDGTQDLDKDGLSDLAEYQNNTLPNNPDSDADLLTDGDEVNRYQTDPLASDSDKDSNPDGFEIAKSTDPNSAASKTERPNIIFILADDLGYGDIGVLFQNKKKGKKMKTPFFDQMAADGLILDRHYCPAPVCAPSRGSLLTGLHQGHANVRDNQFDKALENNHNLGHCSQSRRILHEYHRKMGFTGERKESRSLASLSDQAWLRLFLWLRRSR